VERLFDRVRIDDRGTLLLAAAVLAVANAFLKPVLVLVSIPLIVVTLGLFIIVINIAILGITDWLVDGFDIEGFWTYVGAVIVMGIVNIVLSALLPDGARRRRRR
jgi:putative membrane protein